MLTRAFIVSFNAKENNARVKIPLYNDENLNASNLREGNYVVATIATLPNTQLNFRPGDAVYVEFNENRAEEPVIIGALASATQNKNSFSSIILDTLDVKTSTKLSSDTSIGEVTSTNIGYLKGLSSNAQGQLNTLNKMCQSIVRLSVEGNSLVMIDRPWGLDSQ